MKKLSNLIALVLGLIFIVFGINFWAQFITVPFPPKDSPAAAFLGAMFSSGYLAFVKVFEVLGGLLLIFPKTRNYGLIIIGAILVNIVAFHVFLAGGLRDPLVFLCIIAYSILLYVARCGFCCLACCGSNSTCCQEGGSCSGEGQKSSCCSGEKK
jgi:hypothetical protein